MIGRLEQMQTLLIHRLLSIHNLTYTLGVLSSARAAILDGEFADFRRRLAADRASRDHE